MDFHNESLVTALRRRATQQTALGRSGVVDRVRSLLQRELVARIVIEI